MQDKRSFQCPTFCFQHRTFSKCNVNCIGEPTHSLHRPRQNSVFVGSSATMVTLPMNPPRKTKSAVDIQTLVLADCGPGHSGSIIPMTTVSPVGSRRPSCSRVQSVHVTNVWRNAECEILHPTFICCLQSTENMLKFSTEYHVKSGLKFFNSR